MECLRDNNFYLEGFKLDKQESVIFYKILRLLSPEYLSSKGFTEEEFKKVFIMFLHITDECPMILL